MNRLQKIILIAGLFLLALLGLFPPYVNDNSEVIVDIHYYCIFIPPPDTKIDFSRYLPWMGIIPILTIGLILLFKDKK